jgi:hypothetical protein
VLVSETQRCRNPPTCILFRHCRIVMVEIFPFFLEMRRIIFFVIYQLSNSTLPPERHPGESSLHCAFLTSAQNPLSRIAKRGCTRKVVVDTPPYCSCRQARLLTLSKEHIPIGVTHHGTKHLSTLNCQQQAHPTMGWVCVFRVSASKQTYSHSRTRIPIQIRNPPYTKSYHQLSCASSCTSESIPCAD